MKKFLCLLLTITCLAGAAEKIAIQNRILAKINGQPISVMDVTKKMDFIFFREFQAYAHSDEARLEFYLTNWRAFFDEMVDEQLILSNAKELKITASEGEVRQEIEETLGPNVIEKIDQMGLTYQEVFKMVQNDLTVRRMVGGMVHSKAATSVTPQQIKEAYEAYAQEHPIDEAWNYHVITVRSATELAALAAAQMLESKLTDNSLSLTEAVNTIQLADVKFTVSEELHRKISDLSASHKSVLQGLRTQEHSTPVDGGSKDGEHIYRIFVVTSYETPGKIPYASVEDRLKASLIEKAISQQSAQWRGKLRERYGIDNEYLSLMVPESFKPYNLIS